MDVEDFIHNFENLHMRREPQYRDINILLVGETGAGKSTFINALANYCRYQNFDQAINEELQVLAPTLITLTNKNNETMNIQVASFEAKKQEVGAAGTTDVTSYVLPLPGGNLRLRLIDSPGMGDPDGVDQDDVNIGKILNYLVHLEELHAICFFMKSTTTRNNVLFEYCIKQLMSRLELSASQNIIFVLTNTRSTFYTPGDTKPCLRKVIDDISSKPPHVQIPFADNIFCLDNEAFKFLAAMKHNIKLDSFAIVNSRRSWEISSKACEQLLYYIIGDGSKPPLRPHLMRNTVDVNKAKTLIDHHSEPLAEVCELIDHNIRVLNKHKDDLENDRQELKELRKKLYIPNLTLEIVPLGNTAAVVCKSSKCAKYYEINGVRQCVFEQICQPKCHLTIELIYKYKKKGRAILKYCHVMDKNTCTMCGCHFSEHVLTSVLKRTVPDHVLDKTIEEEMDSKVVLLEKKQTLIKKIEQKTKQHEKELTNIIESVAKFAHFLQNNSISSFSDLFIEEMFSLIKREESFDELANRRKINNLKKILKMYEEAKLRYNSKNTKSFASVGEAVCNIEETFDKLYQLEYSGKIIKDLFEKQQKARSWLFNINLDDNDVPNDASSTVTKLRAVATTSKQSTSAASQENVNFFAEESDRSDKNLAVAAIHNDQTNAFVKKGNYPVLPEIEKDVTKVTCKHFFQQPKNILIANSEEQKPTVASSTKYVEDNRQGIASNADKSSHSLVKKAESVTCQTDLDSTYFKFYEDYLKMSQKPFLSGDLYRKDIYSPDVSYPKQSNQFALERPQYGHSSKFTLPPEQRPNPEFAITGGVPPPDFPPGRSYGAPQNTYDSKPNFGPPFVTRSRLGATVYYDGRYDDYSQLPSQGPLYNRPEPYYDQRYHSSLEQYNRIYQEQPNYEAYSQHGDYPRNRFQYDRDARAKNVRPSGLNYGQNWNANDRIP